MYKRYKERYTFEERVNKVKAFKESDSDKVMIIVEKHPKSKLPDLINSKYTHISMQISHLQKIQISTGQKSNRKKNKRKIRQRTRRKIIVFPLRQRQNTPQW